MNSIDWGVRVRTGWYLSSEAAAVPVRLQNGIVTRLCHF